MKYILLSLLIITLSSCLTTKSTKLNPCKDMKLFVSTLIFILTWIFFYVIGLMLSSEYNICNWEWNAKVLYISASFIVGLLFSAMYYIESNN